METPLISLQSGDSASPEPPAAPAPSRAGDAVGVPKWFVAIVSNNTERAVRDRLSATGIEAYVASQLQLRLWSNGRRKPVEKVLIPTCVFIRCSEAQRRRIVALPFIKRFLADRARAKDGLAAPPAVIPQKEMDTLRFMLGQTDYPVEFTDAPLRPGDKVRVVRGALRGLEGEVLSAPKHNPFPTKISPNPNPSSTPDGSTHLDSTNLSDIIIRLDILGAARVSIPLQDLSPL